MLPDSFADAGCARFAVGRRNGYRRRFLHTFPGGIAIDPLHQLADAAGLLRQWRDVEGIERTIDDGLLAAVLDALGLPAGTSGDIGQSLDELRAERDRPPGMVVGEVGQSTQVRVEDGPAELIDGAGRTNAVQIEGGFLPPVDGPGYYRLHTGCHALELAIAPRTCPFPSTRTGRLWGTVVQIPSLRGSRPAPYGNLGDLCDASAILGNHGADFVGISPVHALIPGTGEDFSPYSPSSRLYLNGALADPQLLGLPGLAGDAGGDLIDWRAALPQQLKAMRLLFGTLAPEQRAQIIAECDAAGPGLRCHALFDALQLKFGRAGAAGWHDWPAAFHDPQSPAVTAFAVENRAEVEFHLFVQWLAKAGLEKVQEQARAGGMPVGLVADLAVGVRPDGSDAWALRAAMLDGLTIGAPPDPLGPLGQNWGITTFSPRGLRATGYAPWIAMLRASLAYSGGIRIDHSYGLSRLWVIPAGGSPADGVYLRYPFEDLVRLATLEALLAGAVLIAEDLGTAPPGFSGMIAERQMLGMRVLWFERAADHGFIGAHDYPPLSVAMTGTHDTATVAGWWKGRDLEWADRLGRLPDGIDLAKAREIRDWDRGLLWSTIGAGAERPSPREAEAVVDAAIRHVARTSSKLVAVPLEDLAGEDEQVNLPGTIEQHPNWSRRFDVAVADMFDHQMLIERLAALRRQVGDGEHDGFVAVPDSH